MIASLFLIPQLQNILRAFIHRPFLKTSLPDPEQLGISFPLCQEMLGSLYSSQASCHCFHLLYTLLYICVLPWSPCPSLHAGFLVFLLDFLAHQDGLFWSMEEVILSLNNNQLSWTAFTIRSLSCETLPSRFMKRPKSACAWMQCDSSRYWGGWTSPVRTRTEKCEAASSYLQRASSIWLMRLGG